MPPSADEGGTPERVEPMTEEREALQELLTEAHQVLKDLRQAVLLAKVVRDDIATVVEKQSKEAIDKVIAEQVDASIEDFHAAVNTAVERTETEIFARFDKIANMLMHGTTKGPKNRATTELEESVRQIVEQRGYPG